MGKLTAVELRGVAFQRKDKKSNSTYLLRHLGIN